jgi:N4-gp56 family major capsid protein
MTTPTDMHKYNAPPGSPSSVGAQMNTFYWHKKAMIEAKKEMYFMPLADTISMPKHYGKEIKVYHYIPLLDDRNISDQGIDATGVKILPSQWSISYPSATLIVANASKAAAVTAINDNVGATLVATAGADGSAGTGFANITLVGRLIARYSDATKKDAVLAFNLGATARVARGNLYGSSRDVGSIMGRLPTLTETGGRVNRVGFTRLERTGSIQKFGFFTEFTQESFDFDSDSELYGHLSREMVVGATQLTEAVLQADLLAAAGTTVFAGAALNNRQVTGEGGTPSVVSYDNLLRLNVILNDNRTPKQTKVITGSRMIDTRTINSGRVMYVGSELENLLLKMVDSFGDKVFIPVNQYADAGTLLNGEIGTIGQFRIVVVPEMLNWAGAGGKVTSNPGYRATNGHYDIFPMMVVGGESFTTIGFQTDGKTTKFKITTKMPGEKTADRFDPYGETGFSSIKWYYGILVMRPERLAVIKTVAPQ